MSEKPDNPMAFPSGQENYWRNEGMTLLDYFAAAALQGILSNPSWREDCINTANIKLTEPADIAAGYAYNYADFMLAERSKS